MSDIGRDPYYTDPTPQEQVPTVAGYGEPGGTPLPNDSNTSGNYGYGPNEPYGSIQYATGNPPAPTTSATTAMGYSLDGLSLGYGTDGKIHIYGERRTLVADPADPKRTIYGYENTDLGAGDDLQAVATASGLPLGAIQGKLPDLQAQWYQTGRTNTQATLSSVGSAQIDGNGNLTYNVTNSLGQTTPMDAATVEGLVSAGKLPGVTMADLTKAKGYAVDAAWQQGNVNTYGYNYFNGGMYTPQPTQTGFLTGVHDNPGAASGAGTGFSGLSRASTGGGGGYSYSAPGYTSGGSGNSTGNTMTTTGGSGGYSYTAPGYTSGSSGGSTMTTQGGSGGAGTGTSGTQGSGVNISGSGMTNQGYGNQLTGLKNLYDTATTTYNLAHLNDIQNQQTAQRQQYFNTAATTGLSRQTTGEGFSGLQPQRLAGT